MEYTNYIEDPKQAPDQFELMRLNIFRAMKMTGKPVYILTMSKENIIHPEQYAAKLKGMPGVYCALPVNGTIDCILAGTEKDAEELAKALHTTTHGEPIGCVRYDGDDIINLYVTLKQAISIARKKGEPWHLYDPNKDSLQARIAKI